MDATGDPWPRRPTLSAVIPATRAFPRVQPTLNALLSDSTVIEVLLVVDGPQSATHGAELDAANACTPRLRVLRLPERVGSETARRIGAEAALGDVVWFVDDDVVPALGCGRGHVDAHVSTGADIVVGELNTPAAETDPVPGRLYESSFQHEFDRFVNDPAAVLLAFWAGNHSVRRASLLRVAPIPPVFRGTNHSDRAFGLSCLRAGLTAVAVPGLKAIHNFTPTVDAWRHQCRRQGAGRGEIHRHFCDLVGPDIADPWSVGLGRRGRMAFRIARRGLAPARVVAGVVGQLMKGASWAGAHGWAFEFGRILRSIEQFRGASVFARGGQAMLNSLAPPKPSQTIAPPTADVSLLVVSRGPAARLRRVLQTWRPHVAEIVVVADRTGDPTLLSAVGDLTDRTAVVDTAFPVEKVLERCYPLCRRAFVFRGDDDEVPSTVLIAELRSLTLDPTLQQAGVPMRWLWPGMDTWIDGYPWSANPQPKLLRNLAGQLHFPVRVHSAEHLDAPIRPVNLPLYHLRTLDPVDERRARARRYARIGGGQPHFDGRPANSQYLPEEAGVRTLTHVPDWDFAPIEFVVSGDAGTHAIPACGTIILPAEPRLLDNARLASVRATGVHAPAVHGGKAVLELVIVNRSDSVLFSTNQARPSISISTRWRALGDGTDATAIDGQRLPIGEPLAPGRALHRVIAAEVPVGPGRYRVTLDLIEEGVAWFGDGDEVIIDVPAPEPARLPAPARTQSLVEVVPSDRSGSKGPEEFSLPALEHRPASRVLTSIRDRQS